jgi:hypothetical protein
MIKATAGGLTPSRAKGPFGRLDRPKGPLAQNKPEPGYRSGDGIPGGGSPISPSLWRPDTVFSPCTTFGATVPGA